MNFVLFFVCAFVSIQSTQGDAIQQTNTTNTDVITSLKHVVEQITNIIANITEQLPPLIEHMKDELQEVVSQIPNLVAILKDKLQEITDKGLKCMNEYKFNLLGLYQCLMEQVEPLVPALQELGDEVVNAYVVAMESAEEAVQDLTKSAMEAKEVVDAKYSAV